MCVHVFKLKALDQSLAINACTIWRCPSTQRTHELEVLHIRNGLQMIWNTYQLLHRAQVFCKLSKYADRSIGVRWYGMIMA